MFKNFTEYNPLKATSHAAHLEMPPILHRTRGFVVFIGTRRGHCLEFQRNYMVLPSLGPHVKNGNSSCIKFLSHRSSRTSIQADFYSRYASGRTTHARLNATLQKHPCTWRTCARVCKKKHNGKENDVLWCLLASLALKQYSNRNKLIKYNSKLQLMLYHSCFSRSGRELPNVREPPPLNKRRDKRRHLSPWPGGHFPVSETLHRVRFQSKIYEDACVLR